MGRALSERVLFTIRRLCLLPAGSRAGVAVSGGADSVALLFLLAELREELGVTLQVLHFNHQLRGAAADADQAFVAELSQRLRLPCTAESRPVAEIARKERWNLEDAARRLRQQFFQDCVDRNLVDCVATAHTADDQAETVLMHLMRGTGVAGLAGIYPVAGKIIRPLLGVRREELRDYLLARGENWREDASNQDTSRMRARIRSQLLPLLARDFAPSIGKRLGSLAEIAREESHLWDETLQSILQSRAEQTSNGYRISIADIQYPFPFARTEPGIAPATRGTAAPPALQKKIIRALIQRVRGTLHGISAQHVDQVLALAAANQGGIETHLPGLRVSRDLRHHLRFEPRSRETPGLPFSYSYSIELPRQGETSIEIAPIQRVLRLKRFDCAERGRDTKDGAAALDGDLLQGSLALRNWRPGDGYRPLGRSAPRKLKRLFYEAHISADARGTWPVLVCGEAIIWSRSFGPAAEFAVTENSRTGIWVTEDII